MFSAMEIYQTHLDAMTRAIMARDFDTVLSLVIYPLSIDTSDAQIVIDNDDDMRTSAEAFCSAIAAMQVRDFHRIAIEAQFDPVVPGCLHGRHRSHMLRGAEFIVPPFENDTTLFERDGRWRVQNLQAKILNRDLTIISPKLIAQKMTRDAAPAPSAPTQGN